MQAFLAAFPEDEAGVDVRDLTVLMDMDGPEEHRMLDRFAAILDGALNRRPPGAEPSLTADEALFILAAAGTPANVAEHCRAVAAVGERLAEALKPHIPALDVALVRAGCLLHDMARLLPNHALLAQEVLTNLGLPRLGGVVGQHMVIAREPVEAPGVTEAELVYLADKLVAKDELVGLDEREARAFRKMGTRPEAAERIRARTRDARAIAEKVAVDARPAFRGGRERRRPRPEGWRPRPERRRPRPETARRRSCRYSWSDTPNLWDLAGSASWVRPTRNSAFPARSRRSGSQTS